MVCVFVDMDIVWVSVGFEMLHCASVQSQNYIYARGEFSDIYIYIFTKGARQGKRVTQFVAVLSSKHSNDLADLLPYRICRRSLFRIVWMRLPFGGNYVIYWKICIVPGMPFGLVWVCVYGMWQRSFGPNNWVRSAGHYGGIQSTASDLVVV